MPVYRVSSGNETNPHCVLTRLCTSSEDRYTELLCYADALCWQWSCSVAVRVRIQHVVRSVGASCLWRPCDPLSTCWGYSS
jgi:hypothetical protein